MSVVPNKYITIIIGVLSCNVMFAAPDPPQPVPPTPPGTPIDGGIYLLIVISFILGIYIVNTKTKKASK